jgi:hypothetical protein
MDGDPMATVFGVDIDVYDKRLIDESDQQMRG